MTGATILQVDQFIFDGGDYAIFSGRTEDYEPVQFRADTDQALQICNYILETEMQPIVRVPNHMLVSMS